MTRTVTLDVCLREIIERGLEDMEDYYLAAEVLNASETMGSKYTPLPR